MTATELDALRAAVLEAEAAFNKELTRSDLAMNAPVFAGLLANIAAKQTQYILALEASLARLQAENVAAAQAREAALTAALVKTAIPEVYEVWLAEYDDLTTISICSTVELAEALVHELAQRYNATKDEDDSLMNPLRAEDGSLVYSDELWNHRAGVTRHKVLTHAAAAAKREGG